MVQKTENITEKKSQSSKNTTSKKTTAKPKTETKKTTKKPASTEKKSTIEVEPVYDSTTLIKCKSVRFGELRYVSKKSGNSYEWLNFGDICYVEYGDLLSLRVSKSKFIFEPWFIIQDSYLTEKWGLEEIYSYFSKFETAEDFLRQDAKLIKTSLLSAPRGYRDLISYTAGKMVRDGEMDSLSVIKVIDDVLHTKLSMLIGGFN